MQHKKTTRRAKSKRAKKITGRKVESIQFEPLETRQLMATINVADFGARPNDGVNDASAIRSAIEASRPGDTILFNGGVFDLGGNDITVPGGGRTYKGANGATLRGKGPDGQLVSLHESSATFTGLTFDGGGLFIDNHASGYNQNIVVDNNVFKINSSGDNPNGIEFTSGLQNSRITNNYFTGYNSHFGIYGYNYLGLTIANNEFVNVNSGMHIDALASNNGNLLVEQNYITGAKNMGMEFQSNAHDVIFQDNWFEHPNLSSDASRNTSSMAFSLILDRSRNVTIRRNVVIAPERPDGKGTRIGFEVGGDNTLIEDNYINGIHHTVAMNDASGSASVTLRNNKFINFQQAASSSFPASNRTWVDTNNGPDVRLSATMEARIAANDKPGVGAKRYGSGGTTTDDNTGGDDSGTETTPPPVVDSPDLPRAPKGLVAMVTGTTSVNLFWSDSSSAQSGYKVQRSADDGKTWTEIASVGSDTASYTITGLTAGESYRFRVCAFNDVGNSLYSNVATATPNGVAAKGGVYLSDMEWESATNYWGPTERDRSNGEQAANDGGVLSIAGKRYAKGLGVHGASEVRYQLNGDYATFVSDIGLDDETDGNGSVVFEVWADGEKLYSSGTMTSADGRKAVRVDVSGKQELTLVVTTAGDSPDFDHGDWANARLMRGVDVAANQDPNTVYLSDAKWAVAKNGWGPPERNRSNGERAKRDGTIISIDGTTYAKGIGMHSDGEIVYNLDGRYSTFSADIGIDDEVGVDGTAVFQVWADGVMLYDSGVTSGADAGKTVTVDVAGRNELWLIVSDAGDGNDSDHADWANARLTLDPNATPTRGVYLSDLVPSSQTNGWGPLELDHSVGEEQAGDGKILTVDGHMYARGLGAHADSRIVYDLNGQYTTFTTDVGIDDEVNGEGSVTFEIWADGEKVYDSGLVLGGEAAKRASVDVAGKNELWLVVTDGGDGNFSDHADWLTARLIAA